MEVFAYKIFANSLRESIATDSMSMTTKDFE